MAEVEILYKSHDSTNWRQGDPMVIRPPGVYVPPHEYEKWVRESVEPPAIANLGQNLRAIHRRFVSRVRFVLSDPPMKEVLHYSRRGMGRGEAANRMDDEKRAHDLCLELGYDTNWGFDDVLTHAVLLADLDIAECNELLCTPTDEGEHPWAPRKRRGKRGYCVHYERILTKDTVERVHDPNERVRPPRGKPSVVLARFIPEVMEPI
jgi:hypothetical protein